MLISCWSVKGGSGTTVVSAALSMMWARLAPGGALLVDLAGEAPLALGAANPPGPGVAEWLAAPSSIGVDALDALITPVGDHLRLLPRGDRPVPLEGRWDELVDTLSRRPGVVVVDASTTPVPPSMLDACDENLLVLRPCYMALDRARRWPIRPSGVVLVAEPGHRLGANDVTNLLGVPVRAVVPWDPGVGRAVDAGLLRSRLPQRITQVLRGAA